MRILTTIAIVDKGQVMGVVLKVGSCQESKAKKIE